LVYAQKGLPKKYKNTGKLLFNLLYNAHVFTEVSVLTSNGAEPEQGLTQTDNVVFIGKKPLMNYVTACITFFNAGQKRVTVKARGLAICKAIDTVELLRRAFVENLENKQIEIGTQEICNFEGQKSNVSTIEITIAKTEPKTT
jgi:DNA-binding protein